MNGMETTILMSMARKVGQMIALKQQLHGPIVMGDSILMNPGEYAPYREMVLRRMAEMGLLTPAAEGAD